MRLWHKDLIPVLPRQQLLAQWRECCCIAKNITVNGTPNHILVNEIMQYDIMHFKRYGIEVAKELNKRGYSCNIEKFKARLPYYFGLLPSHEEMFHGWHNDRYLRQCYYNLQEKYDRGGISEDEWLKIQDYLMSKKEDIRWILN